MESQPTKVIIDYEAASGKRREVINFDTRRSFEDGVKKLDQSPIGLSLAQFVDAATGETIKGKKYDTTTVGVNVYDITKNLRPGVELKTPIEPSQYEPRDRFQENKHMKNAKEKFLKVLNRFI